MKTSFVSTTIALSLLTLVACTPSSDGKQTGSSSSAVSSVGSASLSVEDRDIQVTSPLANTTVKSPLVVTGVARGTWYFEASFPVRLLDGNGVEIAVAPAQAQSDWMTEDFVPFQVSLTFTSPATPTGTLVLQKDNPSGDPINDAELRIPILF